VLQAVHIFKVVQAEHSALHISQELFRVLI